MMIVPTLSAALVMALQPVSQPAPAEPAITELSQLPVGEAAGPRCGVVFAIVELAQSTGDESVKDWPDMASTNGREFFVRAMARLMEKRDLDRDAVNQIVAREFQLLSSDRNKRANDLMQPCLMLLQASGK